MNMSRPDEGGEKSFPGKWKSIWGGLKLAKNMVCLRDVQDSWIAKDEGKGMSDVDRKVSLQLVFP